MNTHKITWLCCVLPALVATFLPRPVHSAVLNLSATEDTYISEHFPPPVGSQSEMIIGTQGTFPNVNRAKNHGLIRFGGISQIPAGATITAVKFKFTVNKAPFSAPADHRLHRLLTAWDEEDSTWFVRLNPDQNWGEPGGAAGTDFVTDSSGGQLIGGASTYTFESTPALIADVIGWVNEPASNFGWLVKPADEALSHTARRIGAREGPSPPSLEISYDLPTPLLITGVSFGAGEVCLRFEAKPGKSYVVERRGALESGPWTTVSNVPPAVAAETVTVCDPLGAGNGFYRLGEQ